MLETLRRIARAPFRRASVTTRLDVEATRGADAVWTSAQSFEALAREGYEQAVWAFAAIRVFTTQVKNTRWILYRGTGDSERELDKHPLLDLLAEPNEDQSGGQLLEGLAAFYLIAGNGYLERVAAGPSSRPVELWVKRPDRMKIKPDPTDRIAGYRYTNAGQSIDLDRWQIMHLKTFNPLSDWYGMSPLSAAARGIDVFNAGQAHNLALMQNGARPSGAWISGGPLDDRVRTRIREELREAAQIGKRGRTLVLEGGITWQELGVTPKDLDFLNGQTDAARQIHAALGIHPVLTGLETGTFENQKQAMRAAVLMTVFPWLDDVTASLNRWLVPTYGDDLRLGYDRDAFPAISEDQDSLWTRAETGWAKGILTRNEARALIGYDAVDEEERGEIFVSELFAGRIPLSTTLPAAKTAPTEDGTGDVTGEPPAPADEDAEAAAAAATAERLARARAAGPDRTRYRRAFHLEDEHDRALYWRSRVDLQERWEARAAATVRGIFEAERQALAERFVQATTAQDLAVITATTLADTERWDALTPVLLASMIAGGEATLDRLETEEAARARRANPALDYQAMQQIFGLVFQETLDVALSHMPKLVGDLSLVTLERTAQQITLGASEGLSVPGIAELIDNLYLEQIIPNRSTVIARTEIIRSSNYGGQQAARGTGLDLTKTWLSTRDDRTREPAKGDRFDHVAADGQTVPIDADYTVSGEGLSYPGDPRGSAGNVIQCRCSEFYTEVKA